MMAVALESAVLHALAITGIAAAIAVPLLLALVRLPAGGAATLAALLLLPALLPLPGLGTMPSEVAGLLPFLALPAAWGLRRIPASTLRIAASLAGPARLFARVWLRLAAPWLLTGLAWGFARALAAAGLAGPAALVLAAAAWPVLRVLAAREA
jgi:ABC-type spermidine/putrescine transport system permease subunit I